jgi:tetratricopeptide (TPR) repeat protein
MVLEPARLQTVGAGYRFRLSNEESELQRLTSRLADAERAAACGDHAASVVAYREAFDMWHAPDVERFAQALLPATDAQWLVDLYLRTLEGWAAESMASDGDASIVERLRAAWGRHPFRERLPELLMASYYQQGRQAEAIKVYERARRILLDELGQDPGNALKQMHARVLSQDISLAKVTAGLPDRILRLPARSVRFLGREQEMAELNRVLASQNAAAGCCGVAIWGQVGVGKTAMALEFAISQKDSYQVIWYIRAKTRTEAIDDLECLANRLGIILPSDREGALPLLWDQCRANARWLLIFDDAPRPQDLAGLWPTKPGVDVVVTSLNPDWGQMAYPFELSVLSRSSTLSLLAQRTGQLEDDGNDELAAELDGLPLACEQAAAYIRQTGMRPQEYVRLFRRRRAQLLERGAPDDHVGTIATTWRLAQAELVVEAPAAVALILLCAHLSGEDIPLALLRRCPELLPEEIRLPISDDLEVEDVISEARRYSLLGREGDHLRMHRLVQAVVLSSLPPGEAHAWRTLCTRLVSAWAPGSIKPETWGMWQQLVPHTIQMAGSVEDQPANAEDLVVLLRRTSEYLVARGSFVDAAALLRRALVLLECVDPSYTWQMVGCTHTELGEVLERRGDVAEAIEHFERGLECFQQESSVPSPWLARTSAGLARSLTCHSGVSMWASKALPEVEQRFVRALAVLTSALGPDHPVVAQALSGLGQIRQDRGNVTGGIECHKKALEIVTAIFGANHPDVGHLHDKLGYALGLAGDVQQSKTHHERAIEILTEVYGEGHPETGWPWSNLGVVLLRAGDVPESVRCQQEAYKIFRSTLGEATATQIAAWRLARAEMTAGRADEAVILLREAVWHLETDLGSEHPDVVGAVADLERAAAMAR